MTILHKIKMFIHKPEGFFLTTSLLFGSILILLIPPAQTPDEPVHFLRAYQVSELGIIPEVRGGMVGAELPKSLSETINLLSTHPIVKFNAGTKYDTRKTAIALNIPLNKHDTEFVQGTTGYSPVGYIPQAAAIFIGSLLNLSPIILMYMTRVAVLATWIALLFMAIKLLPYRKWTVATIALLPMLVTQGLSPGIDAMSIGLAVLFLAIVLKLRQQPHLGRWWVTLLVIASLIALTKQTTILMIGFGLMLKTSQFHNVRWKGILRKSTLFIIPIVLFAIWSVASSHINLSGSGIPGQDGKAQLLGMMRHPLHFPHVLFNTFFTTWGDSVITSFMGDFGWVDTPLPLGIIVIGYMLLGFVLFVGYEAPMKQLTRAIKTLIFTIVALYALGTCVALYLFYSPVGLDIIYGLQGRYFLLMLFMVIPSLATIRLRMPEKNYTKLAKSMTIFLLATSVLTIYLRFYVKLF